MIRHWRKHFDGEAAPQGLRIFNKTVDWSCYQPSSDPEENAYRATWLADYILKGKGAVDLKRRGYDLNGLTGYRRG